MRIVVALGGNALLRRGEPADADTQRSNVAVAATAVAELVRSGHHVVVTHGNGPQVGLLAVQAAASRDVAPYPLDVLGAETEGMIGYLIDQELANRLPRRHVATLLTQVVVDARDPAFARPTKPVGPVYEPAEGDVVAKERGWTIGPDGAGVRRVVASPIPQRIVELDTIRLLLGHGVVVVCVGGGGIPVIERADGALVGVEAVVDKDRAAALLAMDIDADLLLMLTDVDAVYEAWGTPFSAPIRRGGVDAFRRGDYDKGSMGPKVEAACSFVTATGHPAAIGRLVDAVDVVAGRAGTTIDVDADGFEYWTRHHDGRQPAR